MKNFKIDKSPDPSTESLEYEMLLMMHIIDGTEEVGDCWIWQRGTTPSGYPIMKIHGHGCCSVRRVVAILSGHDLAMRQPVQATCNERGCLNPAHLVPSTSSKIGIAAGKRGAFSTMTRRIKVAAGRRLAADVKLDMDKAREIRASDESGPVLAARYGVNTSLINAIKRGDAWIEYGNNPFAGLFAGGKLCAR